MPPAKNLTRLLRRSEAETRCRLQDHPDANILAAFIENSLSRKERSSVLAHVSACDDCREALLLTAEAEGLSIGQSQSGPAQPSRLSNFAWSRLAAAACFACALLIVVSLFHRSTTPDFADAVNPTQLPAVAQEKVPPNVLSVDLLSDASGNGLDEPIGLRAITAISLADEEALTPARAPGTDQIAVATEFGVRWIDVSGISGQMLSQ